MNVKIRTWNTRNTWNKNSSLDQCCTTCSRCSIYFVKLIERRGLRKSVRSGSGTLKHGTLGTSSIRHYHWKRQYRSVSRSPERAKVLSWTNLVTHWTGKKGARLSVTTVALATAAEVAKPFIA